jgi:uncharacterized lipoprotein YmbA
MRINRRTLLGSASVFTVTALAGCASAPTHYYRLAVVPGAVSNGPAIRIGIRSINIPGYLGQTGIAKAGGDYEFSTYPNDIWVEPLDTMLQDIAVPELAQRLPAAVVFASNGSIRATADVLVETNVLRFDPGSSGQVVLTAQFSLKSGSDYHTWVVQTFTGSLQPAGPAVTDIVAAMSALWAKFIDQLAAVTIQQWNMQMPGGAVSQP